MTAVEFLLSHMWTTDWVNYTREEKLKIIEQAKEMEKQQIIDAQMDMFHYLNDAPYGMEYLSKLDTVIDFCKTYGSKVSDDHIVDTNEMIDHIGDANKMVEISDEEIEKGATISEEAKQRAKNYMRLKGALEPKDVVLGYKTSLDAQMLDSQLPQTEISDEEIDKAAKEHFIGGTLWSERVAFKLAIKWYRDRIQAATATTTKK